MNKIIIMLAYLLGAIPSGLILGKILGKEDIRKKGSGNIGATNALRVGGRKLGVLVFIADLLKGLVPVVIAKLYFPEVCIEVVAAVSVLGHIFPVYLGFKGGKGVATSMGVLLGIDFYIGIFYLASWVIIYIITKISSVSSLGSIVLTVGYTYLIDKVNLLVLTFFLAFIIILKHKENILRLVRGQEYKTDI